MNAPPPPSSPRGSSPWVAWLAVLVGVVAAGFGLSQLWLTTQTRQTGEDPSGGMKPIPGVVARAPAPPVAGPAEQARAGGGPTGKTPPPAVPSGTLTFVTNPTKVEVFHKGHRLGETPLFNLSLPAGSQTLQLKLPSGKQQSYPLTIHAGKNTQVRLDLR